MFLRRAGEWEVAAWRHNSQAGRWKRRTGDFRLWRVSCDAVATLRRCRCAELLRGRLQTWRNALTADDKISRLREPRHIFSCCTWLSQGSVQKSHGLSLTRGVIPQLIRYNTEEIKCTTVQYQLRSSCVHTTSCDARRLSRMLCNTTERKTLDITGIIGKYREISKLKPLSRVELHAGNEWLLPNNACTSKKINENVQVGKHD